MRSFHTLKFEKISDCWSFSNLKTLTGCRSFYSHSKYTVFNVFAIDPKDLGHRGWPRKHIKSLAELPQSFLRPASTPKGSSRLEAFNKIISGFVTSVLCKVIAGKYVVRASVRHSQRVNDDPLVNTDLRHFRKRWDYFVSPLLGMQSWTGWLTYDYRECFILFRGNYTNSWKARLHAGKMLMDICRHMSMTCRMRGLRTSIFHRLTTSGQRKARPENWGSKTAAGIEPGAFIFISF